MTIVKCDRCGKIIQYDLPEYYRIPICITRGCVANVKHDIDLCSTCRDSFVNWVHAAPLPGRGEDDPI